MYVVSKRDIQIFLDPDTKEPYEAESYILTNRQRITWDHKSQSWRDRHGKEYTPVTMGKIVGFNRKNTLSEIDKQLLSITPEGRAYVEYNERIGGEVIGLEEPWGYPPCISEYLEQGHTLEELYRECIERGVCWEELFSCYIEHDPKERMRNKIRCAGQVLSRYAVSRASSNPLCSFSLLGLSPNKNKKKR